MPRRQAQHHHPSSSSASSYHNNDSNNNRSVSRSRQRRSNSSVIRHNHHQAQQQRHHTNSPLGSSRRTQLSSASTEGSSGSSLPHSHHQQQHYYAAGASAGPSSLGASRHGTGVNIIAAEGGPNSNAAAVTTMNHHHHYQQQQQQPFVRTEVEENYTRTTTTMPPQQPPASSAYTHNAPQRFVISSINQNGALIPGQLNFVDEGKCMVRDFCMPRDVISRDGTGPCGLIGLNSGDHPHHHGGNGCGSGSGSGGAHCNRNQIMLSSFAICFQKFHFIEPTRREFSLHRSGEFRLEDPNWVYLFSPKHDSYDAYLIIVRKSCTRKNVSRDVIMHYDMKLLDPSRPSCTHVLPVTGKAVVVSNSTRVPQELHAVLQNSHFIGCDYEIRKIPEDIVEQIQKTSGYDLWVFIQVQRTKERRLLSAFDPEIIQPNGPLADVDVVVVEVDDWAEEEKETAAAAAATATSNAIAAIKAANSLGPAASGLAAAAAECDAATAAVLLSAAASNTSSMGGNSLHSATSGVHASSSNTSGGGNPRKRAKLDTPVLLTTNNNSSSLGGGGSNDSAIAGLLNLVASSNSLQNTSKLLLSHVPTLSQAPSTTTHPLRTVRLRLDRNILAARSGFFRDELTRIKMSVEKGVAEDTYQTWQVQINCKVGIFQKIVRYIYYGEVDPITLDYLEAVDMFKAVHKLRLGELKKAILERMAFILQEGKYLLEAYCFANKYQIAPLKRHVEMLSLKFPGKTFQGDDWMSFVEYCPNLVANMLEGVL